MLDTAFQMRKLLSLRQPSIRASVHGILSAHPCNLSLWFTCGKLAFAPVLKRDPTLHVYVTTVTPEDCDLQWTVFNHSFKRTASSFSSSKCL